MKFLRAALLGWTLKEKADMYRKMLYEGYK